MNQLIEKLKDKTYVRAFGLMTEEEQQCFKKTGKANCLSYTNIGWSSTPILTFVHYLTYAIKPGYQPEPEFVGLEIVELKQDTGKRSGKMAVKLGEKYKDSLTGFEGIATARTEYLTGCARVVLEAMKGDEIKEYWFDETRLKGVKLTKAEKKPGGPGKVAPSRDPVNL